MSDDLPRSTHGNRPPQRRGKSAPAWWSRLERNDLPGEPSDAWENGGMAAAEPSAADAPIPHGDPATRSRRSSALIYLVVAAAAVFVILVGVGASSTHAVLAALLVIAVPFGLATLVAAAVVRRSGP